MSNPKHSSRPKGETQERERQHQENAPLGPLVEKTRGQARCYTFPWARSRGGAIFLIIVLISVYLIYKWVDGRTSGNQLTLLPGSSPETAISIPCGTSDFVTLDQLGIQNWKGRRFAYFILSPGCTSPWIMVPDEVRSTSSRFTFRVRPSGSMEKRHYLPSGKEGEWYWDNPGKRIRTPVESTARQWRNSGKSPVLIKVEFIK